MAASFGAQPAAPGRTGSFAVKRGGADSLAVIFSGDWSIRAGRPGAADIWREIEASRGVRRISMCASGVSAWDGTLAGLLFDLVKLCRAKNIQVDRDELPEGLGKLLGLALAVPEKKGARREAVTPPWLERIGEGAVHSIEAVRSSFEFIGETSAAFLRLLAGKARLPRGQMGTIIEETGPAALPIVTLISLLVGMILAFIGAIQLRQFGAQIYVANLVGIAMVREMGAIMAGIIMAGRTGAAFAAQLGAMQVNEEIDALKTLGMPPVEFLVLPRIAALVLMMPLLCLYADLMGIAGGFLVSVGALGISAAQYLNQTCGAFGLSDVWIGLAKSAVFGMLVAFTGCMRGMQCGRSAAAVGQAVTAAVVTGIVCIVVTDAVFAVVTNVLRI